MPAVTMTYEYLCTACGRDFEADQRISEPPLEDCPHCGKKSARRMVSGGGGFILKGGGWYADGYASKGSPSKSAPGEGSTAEAKKSEGSTTEAKKSEGSAKKTDTASNSAAA
jgi:putative FmdB family regulatory protein